MTKRISFQGQPGAFSDLACRVAAPEFETLPCPSFEDAFIAVRDGKADLAMIPVENSTAGRVADVHHLLRESGLSIIAEHYQPVALHLLGVPGAKVEGITSAYSHIQPLTQSRHWLRDHAIQPVVKSNTASAAAEVASLGDPSVAAIASELAGKIYGLTSLVSDIADQKNNTTRFLILSPEAERPVPGAVSCITTIIFRVRSVPAALYKALGGFATNGINLTKLESYLVDGNFNAAQFYVDVEGHPEETSLRLALEELAFFAHEVKVMGTYPAHSFRKTGAIRP